MIIMMHFLNEREGLTTTTDTTSQSCLNLSSQNRNDIQTLTASMETILALQDKVNTVQQTADGNAEQLNQMTSYVYKHNDNGNDNNRNNNHNRNRNKKRN